MDDEQRRKDLGDSLRALYARLGKLLKSLVLPIEIPSPADGQLFGNTTREALITAYKALQDIPMDEAAKVLISMFICDWIMAADVMFDEMEDPDPVNLTMITLQRHRMYKTVLTLDHYNE